METEPSRVDTRLFGHIMNFEDAVNYPRQGDDPWRTILIGGVLGLLSVLVVPVFLVLGYYVRTLRAAIENENEPPVFDEFGDLFVDGITAFVVGFVYLLIPALVFGFSVGGIAISAILTGDVGIGAIAGAVAGFSLSFVLGLIAWYVLPAAIANAIHEGRIGAGFAFGTLRRQLLSGTYVVAWLMAFGLFIVGGIVTSILSVIPPLGFIAGAFVNFYVGVAAFYLYGRAYAEMETTEPTPQAPAGQTTA